MAARDDIFVLLYAKNKNQENVYFFKVFVYIFTRT